MINKKKNPIAVIGAGPMGRSIAALLAQAGWPVGLWGRQGSVASVRLVENKPETIPLSTAIDYELCPFVVWVVKAYQIPAASDQWLTGLVAGGSLAVVANGDLDSIWAPLQKQRRDVRLRRGIVTFGATSRGRDTVIAGSTGKLTLGGGPPSALESAVVESVNRFTWVEDIETVVAKKWIANTVVNSLCAINNLDSNGQLVPDQMETMRSGVLEACQRVSEKGLSLNPDTVYKDLIDLIHDTRENQNSMVGDLRAGRKTENEFLAGVADPQRYKLLAQWADAIREKETLLDSKL